MKNEVIFKRMIIFFCLSIIKTQEIQSQISSEFELSSNQLQIKISLLFNFHCINDNEQFCHPYFVLSLSKDQVKNFSPSIKCTRNPDFAELLSLTPKYCDNIIAIQFYEFLSLPIMKNLLEGTNSEIFRFENIKNFDLRETISFSLENVPIGETNHFIMLNVIDYDDDVYSNKYILPSCVNIALSWKSENCLDKHFYDNLKAKSKIKGLKYCKQEFSNIFVNTQKILSLEDDDYEAECETKKEVFEFNKILEIRIYAIILKNYYQIMEKTIANLYFFMHYNQYLKFHINIFPDDLEQFHNDFKNYTDILGYLTSQNYEISLKENSRYLNRIVFEFLQEKDNENGIIDDLEINKTIINNNNLMENIDKIQREKNFSHFISKDINGEEDYIIRNFSHKKIKGNRTILQKMLSYHNKTSNYSNHENQTSNILNHTLKNNETFQNSKIINKTVYNESISSNYTSTNESIFTDYKILRNFSDEKCPDDFICLLNETLLKDMSDGIVEDYLNNER